MVAKQSQQAMARRWWSMPFSQISWMPLLITTTMVSIGIAGIMAVLDSRRQATEAPQVVQTTAYQSPLGLKVASRKQQVEIRWDHQSSAVRKASKGLIRVTEGEMSEMIPLDWRDLRDGYLAYVPMTNDVRIRLEVSEQDGSLVTESTRIVAIP